MIEILIRFYESGFYIYWENKEKLHRLDGPAVICPDGTEYWYKDGLRHRVDDKPAITFPDGAQYWYKKDKFHRDDGPAVIYSNGTEYWYKEGKLIKRGTND